MPDHKQTLTDAGLIEWRAKGQIIPLNGQDIFVIDDQASSEQATLLMIHGFPTSSWDWAPMWDTLRKHYRLVCIDMLGFGFSAKPNKRNYTIHKQADLFEELAAKLELGQFHVLAHDYGVSVAQELLARQLDKTNDPQNELQWLSCTFLNGGLFPETHQALFIQKLMLSPLGKLINNFTGFKLFCTSFSKVFGENSKPSPVELQQFWEVINYNNGRHVFHNLITYMHDRQRHRERWVAALQNSKIPLAVINGSLDPVSGQHLVKRYKELNCRLDLLIELAEIGHYPQVEDPASVAEGLIEFIEN